ncbi:Hypothetical predicted protein [Mytilus galloprovincialis]|uniref:B box-type domain-containing protein n=1 Tax=Mytilus galloprovincialis TaxID=29158 RepID=A0A8B6CL92_MYTGA|nr:Hypothetical predicted protein [Mytilus galloprovincialis]
MSGAKPTESPCSTSANESGGRITTFDSDKPTGTAFGTPGSDGCFVPETPDGNVFIQKTKSPTSGSCITVTDTSAATCTPDGNVFGQKTPSPTSDLCVSGTATSATTPDGNLCGQQTPSSTGVGLISDESGGLNTTFDSAKPTGTAFGTPGDGAGVFGTAISAAIPDGQLCGQQTQSSTGGVLLSAIEQHNSCFEQSSVCNDSDGMNTALGSATPTGTAFGTTGDGVFGTDTSAATSDGNLFGQQTLSSTGGGLLSALQRQNLCFKKSPLFNESNGRNKTFGSAKPTGTVFGAPGAGDGVFGTDTSTATPGANLFVSTGGGLLLALQRQNLYFKKSSVFKSQNMAQCPKQNFCEMCMSAHGTQFCLDCNQYFCPNCKTSHLRIAVCRDHRFKNSAKKASDTSLVCQDHNELFVFICDECDVPVCRICTVKSHKGHSMADIEETVSKKKNNFLAFIRSILSTDEFLALENSGNIIDQNEVMLDESVNSTVESIQRDGEAIKMKVDKVVDKMIQDVNTKSLNQNFLLNKAARKTNDAKEFTKSLRCKEAEIRTSEDTIDLLFEMKSFEGSFEMMKIPFIPTPYSFNYTRSMAKEDDIIALMGKVAIKDGRVFVDENDVLSGRVF